MSKLTSRGAPTLTPWERLARALLACLLVVFHGYAAVVVYAEAMVNETKRTGTPYAITLQLGIGSACLVSFLILIGAIRGWKARTILILGVFLAAPWLLVIWFV